MVDLKTVGASRRRVQPTYCRSDMARALKEVGLKRGDVVFSHGNIGYFGYPDEGRTKEVVFQVILRAFRDVIGKEGTLAVPAFTYSFCKGEPFDPDHTPSVCGVFPEMVRLQPNAHRSLDPIFSVAVIGPMAKSLTSNVPKECFGQDCFWDRLLRADGVICNLNFDAGSTFIHYVERCLNVPYRFNKVFPGTFMRCGRAWQGEAVYFCRDLANPDTRAAFEILDATGRELGLVRTAMVGRGSVVSIRAADIYRLIESELKSNPWLLTAAGKTFKSLVAAAVENS